MYHYWKIHFIIILEVDSHWKQNLGGKKLKYTENTAWAEMKGKSGREKKVEWFGDLHPFSYDSLDEASNLFIILKILSQSSSIFNPYPAQ